MTQPPIPEGEKKEIIQILTEIEQSSTSGDPLRDIEMLKGMATNLKNKLKNSQPETQAGGEWIDVDTKLPDQLKDVLFYNSGYKLCFIGRLYDKYEKTFWDQSADTHTKVTHWMPLPEPPTPQ